MYTRDWPEIIRLAAVLLVSAGVQVHAADPETDVEELIVSAPYDKPLAATGNAADQVSREGVDFSSAGGISSLPVIRGLNDERIRLVVDGAELSSACANHMNPPLSYVDASQIEAVEVIAGLTPVSAGGDSIGATIEITTDEPVYADNSEALLTTGSAAYFYRSNNHKHGASLKAGLASQRSSLAYSGSYDKADSYRAGDGDKVLDTLYRSETHNLTLGMRGESQAMTLRLTHQKVPYQGFPNQYMDMVDNTSYGARFHYYHSFSWGRLDTRVSWQDVEHEMGFFSAEKTGTMPMLTEGEDIAYTIALEVPYDDNATLRLGHEFYQFRLDDWWPAVAGSAMLGPNDYVNINNGQRRRFALFAESENPLGERWQSLFGLRYERVAMDTDEVQPYNTMPGMAGANMNAMAAEAFNARDHRRTDDNIDITLLARYSITADQSLEFGYARKTRSPNLYERYSWGRGTMAMTMIGWYGDGNGYVGDIALEPEIAHTLAVTYQWRRDDNNLLSIEPYYSYVDDYIDARQVGSFNPRMAMAVSRPLLQFTNIDARLYGAEMRGRKLLLSQDGHNITVDSRIAYTRGERNNDAGDLYHIMPLNIKMALEHSINAWTNRLELQWVDSKDRVDERRLESTTDSYTLINLASEVQFRRLTLSADISNLFDRDYELPLGGVYLSGWLAGDRTEQFANLPGEGRSCNLGMRYRF